MPITKWTKDDAEWLSKIMIMFSNGEITTLSETQKKRFDLYAKRIASSAVKIKPRSAKNKGASWQKDVARELSEITEVPFDNQSDQSEILCRTMGCSGNDIILRGKALERFPFGTECKDQNNVSLPDWCRQAASNEINGKWMLFIKSALLDEPIVAFPMRLLKEYFKKEFGRW